MRNALAGHTNSFHTYGREEALAGIAQAGYRTVELTAVEGWTEHVDLDADTGELRARLAH
jgi:L-ribulose-5-phosphate 3-epimerase